MKALKRGPENSVTYIVGKILKSLTSRDYMGALASLDRLCEFKNSDRLYLVRASIRNLVMDLTGSLVDLDRLTIHSEDSELLRANVLSKMGKLDESISIIRGLGSKKGIGIAGRRMDLSLMGITDGSFPDHIIAGWEVGCVAGHLLALAEWKILEDTFDFMDKADSQEYFDIFRGLKESGALFDRGPDLGVASEIEKILGWFSQDEAEYMAKLAMKAPAGGSIVEIGSFCGRSTISLILGSRKGMKQKVHSVDPHFGLSSIYPESTFPMFVRNLEEKNLLRYVTIHRCKSADAVKLWNGNRISLLFIDADHSYDSVCSDFYSWRKYLQDGALVVFHDYPQEGPNKLIREILADNPKFFPHSFMDSLFVLEYRSHAAIVDFSRNAAFIKFLELMGRSYNYWIKSEEERSVEKSVIALKEFTKDEGET